MKIMWLNDTKVIKKTDELKKKYDKTEFKKKRIIKIIIKVQTKKRKG